MQRISHYWLIVSSKRDSRTASEHIPTLLALFVYLMSLTFLATIRPRQCTEATAAVLRLLIVVVGLVLIVVALVAAGAPESVGPVIEHWPLLP